MPVVHTVSRHSQPLSMISHSLSWGLRMCAQWKIFQPPSSVFLSFAISMCIAESQAGTVKKLWNGMKLTAISIVLCFFSTLVKEFCTDDRLGFGIFGGLDADNCYWPFMVENLKLFVLSLILLGNINALSITSSTKHLKKGVRGYIWKTKVSSQLRIQWFSFIGLECIHLRGKFSS